MWLIEATPKDDYYNYGRMIYYVDKQCYFGFYKEIYDRSGNYWKTVFMHPSHQVTQKGTNVIPQADGYCTIDDKTDHSTYARLLFVLEMSSNFRTLHLWENYLTPSA